MTAVMDHAKIRGPPIKLRRDSSSGFARRRSLDGAKPYLLKAAVLRTSNLEPLLIFSTCSDLGSASGL